MTRELHFKCLRCGHVFTMDDAKKRRYCDGDVDVLCPICENDEFDEVEQCVDCGEWFDSYELYGSQGSCRCVRCLESQADFETAREFGQTAPVQISGLYSKFFVDEKQIEDVLNAYIDAIYTEAQKAQVAVDSVNDDLGAFAEYLERREAQI